MQKLITFLIFLVPISVLAQTVSSPPDTSSSSSSSTTAFAPQSGQTTTTTQTGQKTTQTYATATGIGEAPVASIAMHYNYMFQTSPYGGNRGLMGWSVVPSVNIRPHIALQADFTSLYMQGIAVGEKRLLIAAGPRYTFAPRHRFTPFVYGEAGEMRTTTKANDVADWNPVVRVGVGFNHKGYHGVGIQFIPGEYIGEKVQWRDQWNNSFSARIGIVFDLYK